jgi:hypothetical protein
MKTVKKVKLTALQASTLEQIAGGCKSWFPLHAKRVRELIKKGLVESKPFCGWPDVLVELTDAGRAWLKIK